MAIYMWREYIPPELCFTAEKANSTVQLNKNGSSTPSVSLETSTDGINWSDYTIDSSSWKGDLITLNSIGDKVYFRNKSETPTAFSNGSSNYYKFTLTGLVGASGDITSLLCKNLSSKLVSGRCFTKLFLDNTALTKTPKIPATTLSPYCYVEMFSGCTKLETIPNLPATTLTINCYEKMFYNCSKIKLSSSQTGDYQTAYRIPTEGTGSTASSWNSNMFAGTGGTTTSVSLNTTYYTSNTIV